jgi:spore coat protein SA
MEATAAALPIITTGVGALPEAVIPGETGIVVPAGGSADLRSALESLAGAPARRQLMGKAGRQVARKKFNSVENNYKVLDFIEEMIDAESVVGKVA